MSDLLGVVFDFDGLLADTEPIWGQSARLLVARRGLEYDPELEQLSMGRHPVDVGRLFAERYRLDERPERLAEERLSIQRSLCEQGGVSLLPGAGELVAELSSLDVPLAVASGSPSDLLVICLGRLGLRESMRAVVGSDQVERGKPAPDLFLLAAERLGLDPRSCIALEDSEAGIAAALAARMVCVAVGRKGPATAAPPLSSSEATREGAMAKPQLEVDSLLELGAGDLRRLVDERKDDR